MNKNTQSRTSSKTDFEVRKKNEIAHGEKIAQGESEAIWGWGSLAGKIRAERRAQLIAEGAGLAKGMRVLEIGCGTGNFTEKFAKYGADILACDLSPHLLEKAKKRDFGKAEVCFICSPFEECGTDGAFDAIIGSSILHHLEIEQAFPKIHELLKPGGKIAFAEPNMLNPQIFIERRFRHLFSHISENETAFVHSSLKKTLQGVGFNKIDITPFDWLHPATPESLIGFVSSLGKCIEHTPVLRQFSGSLLIVAEK
ncbi:MULTISPECIES: class I SAM-dependent methyltransferase [unclassified Pseudodesulfovibrio]|uniref:class I SAM-dependent methyltransferase n=1 Tax=unclassified Pseudodesulfovibrio TaxID=2661612 RepID=UPI000FEB5F3F|nr:MULTISPECIES: class I SAM-dependent methyltransferase [unclassified Pseudodesulfovibrio]MCJ2164147.1 class I SAM-dependent methyltransferase [Pseudodesulfovibrio sp. S3-i]RWU05224.1 class I SAM-dependent methyltransferase [Pseudodesulfovibrio sp. S3]